MAGILEIINTSVDTYTKNFEKFLYLIMAQIGLIFGMLFFSKLEGLVALVVYIVLSLVSLLVSLTLTYLAKDPEKMTLEEAYNIATSVFLKVILYNLFLGLIFGFAFVFAAFIAFTIPTYIASFIVIISFMILIFFVVICVLPESYYILLSTRSVTAAINKISSPNVKKNLKYSVISLIIFIPIIIATIFSGALLYTHFEKGAFIKDQFTLLYAFLLTAISAFLSPIVLISFWKVFEE